MRLSRLAVVVALALPAALGAQTIDPGFTRAQVEAKFGPPVAVRAVGEFTYLFYNNGCEITCGQHDIVTLRNDKVTDAILRGKARHYSGRSSSPPGRPHQATPASDATPAAATNGPAAPAKPQPTPGSGSAAVPKKP